MTLSDYGTNNKNIIAIDACSIAGSPSNSIKKVCICIPEVPLLPRSFDHTIQLSVLFQFYEFQVFEVAIYPV